MKVIHVLSIGNSFSQDAHCYLHDFAKSEGIDIETVNLFVGGCSLERHYRNMIGNKREYTLEINGHRADGFLCSIDEALTARQWDFITLQQARPLSYLIDSYEPYLQRLNDTIVMVNETLAVAKEAEIIKEQAIAERDIAISKKETALKDCTETARKVSDLIQVAKKLDKVVSGLQDTKSKLEGGIAVLENQIAAAKEELTVVDTAIKEKRVKAQCGLVHLSGLNI